MSKDLQKKPSTARSIFFAGSLGLSLLLHVGLLLMIGGVVLIQGAIPQKIFRGDLYSSDSQTAADIPIEDTEILPEMTEVADTVVVAGDAVTLPGDAGAGASIDVLATTPTSTAPQLVVTGPGMAFSASGIPGQGAGASTEGSGTGGRPGTGMISTILGTLGEYDSGLVGRLYDLKQDASRSPSSADYGTVLSDFMKQGWDVRVLQEFYRASQVLTAYQIYIPKMGANVAPSVFNAEKEIRPSKWVIHYRGDVISPESGTFRFVGRGDDVLVVRFNNEVVLNGSLMEFDGTPKQDIGSGLYAGSWFKLKKGESYPMEVLLGERPGGFFSGVLFIEEKGEEYEKGPGMRLLPVFQTAKTDIPSTLPNAYPVAAKPFTCLPVKK